MYDFATGKIQEMEDKICDLKNMKNYLEDLVERCPGAGVPKSECPIIKNLSEGVN
jgi:hypothetical protein